MILDHALAAPIAAVVATAVFMQASVIVTGLVRRRDYRRFEDRNREAVERRIVLPEVAPGEAEQRYEMLAEARDRAHQAADVAQTRYYNAVLSSAGCLVLAFLALASSMLLASVAPPQMREALETLVAWLDAIATLAVLALFFYGRSRNAPWLSVRSRAELMRQFQVLEAVFPGPESREGRPADAAHAEAEKIAKSVGCGPSSGLVARVEKFWQARRAGIAARAMDERDLTAEAVLLYLRKRPRRQLWWFADSRERLEHIAERRKAVLLGLYVAVAVLACVNLDLLLASRPLSDYIHPLLMIVVGLAAAMTAFYVNQNSRSLIHRYRMQERSIEGWLRSFDGRWRFSQLPAAPLDAAAKVAIREEILKFEDLMIEELIDWLYITSYDSIELAP